MLDSLPFPFDFELESMPNFERKTAYNFKFSNTGILIKMKRKSLGQLVGGYYYPTTSFAFLSMISFLIKPDVVSTLKKAQRVDVF